MRGALVVVAAVVAFWLAAPGVAQAGPCGLPDAAPWWIDFADGSVPFRGELAKPGMIIATSGGAIPAAFRNAGAQTVYWEMHFEFDVGTPGAPAAPDSIGAAADALFSRAAASSGCATPVIGLNEMLGVAAPPPLSDPATQYRMNVLAFVQELTSRGAIPFVLLASSPNATGGETGFWQQLASYAYLVREVHEPAPKIVNQSVDAGSRTLRVDLRTAAQKLDAIGVPAARVGLMLGFQSGGTVGRAGLQPLPSWLEYVKLATLAAKQVAGELGIGSVWTWGWGTLSAAGVDPDKATAACVALWTRDPTLCDAPSLTQFDTSLTDGQLSSLPPYAQCVIDGRVLPANQLTQAQQLLGSPAAGYTALLERLAATALVPVTHADEQQAERSMFPKLGRFLAATRTSGVTPGFARGVIVDQLRFAQVSKAALIAEEQRELGSAVCRGDSLPTPGDVRLASRLPFLAG
jgi:hypothetical protein